MRCPCLLFMTQFYHDHVSDATPSFVVHDTSLRATRKHRGLDGLFKWPAGLCGWARKRVFSITLCSKGNDMGSRSASGDDRGMTQRGVDGGGGRVRGMRKQRAQVTADGSRYPAPPKRETHKNTNGTLSVPSSPWPSRSLTFSIINTHPFFCSVSH